MPRGATPETMRVLRAKFEDKAKWEADLQHQEEHQSLLREPKKSITASIRDWLSGPHP